LRSYLQRINIDEESWKRFSVLFIETRRLQKEKNEVIEELIKEYVAKKPKQ